MKKLPFYSFLGLLSSIGSANASVDWTLGTSGDLQDSTTSVVMNADCTDGICDVEKIINSPITEQLNITGDASVTDITEINIFGKNSGYLIDRNDFENSLYITGVFNNGNIGENVDLNIIGDINSIGHTGVDSGSLAFNSVNIDGNMSYLGDISAVVDGAASGANSFGLRIYNSTIGGEINITGNTNFVTKNVSEWGSSVYIYNSSVGGNFIYNGDSYYNSDGYSLGLYTNKTTYDKNFEVYGDFNLVSSDNSANAIQLYTVTVLDDFIYEGNIVSDTKTGSMGVAFVYSNVGDVYIETDMLLTGEKKSRAILYHSSNMTGDLNLDGDFLLTDSDDEVTSKVISLEGTSAITGNINYNSGTMNTEVGFYVNETSSISGTFTNNGVINASVGSAIEYYGVDNAFTYSGTGELNAELYDIDMGGDLDSDVLDIINATIANINVNSAETLNITDSTMNLSLTAANKNSALMQTTGTTVLNFNNVTLNINANYDAITSFNGGEYFVIAEAGTISNDLTQLTLNITNYNADGTLSIFDNAGTDQLIYTFAEEPTFDTGSGAINPGQGAQIDLASSSGVMQGSVSSAASSSSAAINVVQGRQMAKKYDAILEENSQLASLDAMIMSDAGNIFRIDEDKKLGVWMQITSKEDSYDGAVSGAGISSTGYETDSLGITFGYDEKITNELLAGVALTYSKGDVKGNSNSFETDMDSLNLSLYGSYLMDDRTFVDAIVGYGIGSYEQRRNTGSDIAKADYDSTQISAQATLGKVFVEGDRMLLTPFVKTSYIHVSQDSYNETGSTADLSIEAVSFDSFQAGLGMEFGYVFNLDDEGTIMPTLSLELAREMGDNAFSVSSTVIGTGLSGTTYTSPDMGRDILRLGAGVSYLSTEGHEISFDYENETRENYDSNTMYLKGKYMF